MESRAKIIILILGAMLLISGLFAFQVYNAKQEVVNKYDRDVSSLKQKNEELASQLKRSESDRQKAQRELDEIQSKFDKIANERDEVQKKYDEIIKERDELKAKVEELRRISPALVIDTTDKSTQEPSAREDKAYWANILKDRSALKLKLSTIGDELINLKLNFEDALKEKKNLELALSELTQMKDDLTRKLEYNQQLADNLANELAREVNDKQFLLEQYNRIKQENMALKSQLKDLAQAKVSLEKSLVRQQSEKSELDERLEETEQIINSRINDIELLKEEIEQGLDIAGTGMSQEGSQESKAVELPPIVVYPQGTPAQSRASLSPVKSGRVVSVNESSNFVVIDLGENDGVAIRDRFNIFHGSKRIATVEVIQLRKDISAADIIEVTDKISPDDIARSR